MSVEKPEVPLRDVLREVEVCFAIVNAGVGPWWRHNELLALVTKSCAPRLAAELRAIAPLLRRLCAEGTSIGGISQRAEAEAEELATELEAK